MNRIVDMGVDRNRVGPLAGRASRDSIRMIGISL
jgi:hypothetical protein